VYTGAVFQGAYDAGISLFDFVVGVSDLANPTNTLMDGLKSAWSANQDNGASSWYETFNSLYDDKHRERWVRAIGFSPSDISREDIAKAYELASLVMTDDQFNATLKDFAADYAVIQPIPSMPTLVELLRLSWYWPVCWRQPHWERVTQRRRPAVSAMLGFWRGSGRHSGDLPRRLSFRGCERSGVNSI